MVHFFDDYISFWQQNLLRYLIPRIIDQHGQKFFQRVYICDRQTLSIPIFHCILMFSLQYIQAVLLPNFYWISGRHNYTATLLTFYHIKARSQRLNGFTFSAYPFMWFYCLFCFYVLHVVVTKYVWHILRTYTFFFQVWNL